MADGGRGGRHFEVVAVYTAAVVPPAREEKNARSRRITDSKSEVDGQ